MYIYILKAREQGNTMAAFIFPSEVTLRRRASVKLLAIQATLHERAPKPTPWILSLEV